MLLCGIDINTDDTNDSFYDTILDINGIGANRIVADMTSNKQAGGWSIVMPSCIARLTPFTITLLLTGNIDWVTKVKQVAKKLTIQFPAEAGYASGIKVEFMAVVNSISINGSIEGRTVMTVSITPSGAPTLTAAVAS